MRVWTFLTIGLLAFGGAAACSDDAQTCDPNCGQGGDGAGGDGGSGAQGGSGGSGAQGGGGSGGGQASCGGISGESCEAGFFCDYQPSHCGAADGQGVCTPIPEGCTDEEILTCGCDGQVHGNPCEANAAGTDIAMLGGCTPPTANDFPCGAGFCDATSQYCRRAVSDVGNLDDVFSCEPLPAACGNTPDCSCLANEPCGDMCEAGNTGGFVVTCPGG